MRVRLHRGLLGLPGYVMQPTGHRRAWQTGLGRRLVKTCRRRCSLALPTLVGRWRPVNLFVGFRPRFSGTHEDCVCGVGSPRSGRPRTSAPPQNMVPVFPMSVQTRAPRGRFQTTSLVTLPRALVPFSRRPCPPQVLESQPHARTIRGQTWTTIGRACATGMRTRASIARTCSPLECSFERSIRGQRSSRRPTAACPTAPTLAMCTCTRTGGVLLRRQVAF